MTAVILNAESPYDIPLSQGIRDELAAAQKNRAELLIPAGHPTFHLLILLGCVLVNIAFFVARPDYFGLFIAASFYLNMFYFITLILPTNLERKGVPANGIPRIRRWVAEIGIRTGVSRFSRLFINSFFINSRSLSLGLGLLFSLDMVFALYHYYQGGIPLRTAAIVIVQCAIIVIFYFLVWKMEPFSTTYVQKVEQVKKRLHRRNVSPRMIAAIFLFGFILAVSLLLITIIYLPGVTVNAFLKYSELSELGHLFSLLAILAVSQYFIIRSLHGMTSKAMAERLFDFREQTLQDLLDAENAAPSGNSGPGRDPPERSLLLLESKIFIVKRRTLAGFFPVFIVDLDFSVLLDTTPRTAVRGFIAEKQ